MHKWTEEQIGFIKANIKGCPFIELTDKVNKQFGLCLSNKQVIAAAKNRRLTNGLDRAFKKGNIPYNKGKKIGRGPNHKGFEKGRVPHNHLPVGSERITDGYILVKTAEPRTWKLKHRVIWEKANGPIPEGHVLLFADSNKLNCKLDNLMLITKKERAVLNSKGLLTTNREINETAVLIADTILKCSDLKRKQKERRKSEHR